MQLLLFYSIFIAIKNCKFTICSTSKISKYDVGRIKMTRYLRREVVQRQNPRGVPLFKI